MGSIYFYKVDQINQQPIYHTNHQNPVTQIKLWYLGYKKLFAVTTSARENLKFWDVYQKREIVTPETYNGRNLCISLNRRLFVEHEFTITEYNSDSEGIHQGASCWVEVYDDPEAKFLEMYSEKDKLKILIQFGMAASITIFRIQQNNPVFTRIDDDFYPLRAGATLVGDDLILDDDLICEFHISTMSVTVLAHAGFLTVRIDTEEAESFWEEHSIPLAENEIVTSVFMFADLLLVGLNTGNINVYAVKNIISLLNTAQLFQNLRVIQVDTSPIIGLNSTEINKKSYILASTKSKLFAINVSV